MFIPGRRARRQRRLIPMVTVLRPDEVKAKYGPLFCRGFITIVDEKAGKAKII